MSVYTDYEKVSEHYDDGRRPAGADVIAGLITIKLGKPLKDVHILDIGCGTGNYSLAMLQLGVGKITLADANQGMMKKAREKLELGNYRHKVDDICETVLPSLPFPDQKFDAIMINQVLHHLELDPDGEHFPTIQETFSAINRVLKPGGVLAITNTCKDQFYGVWFCNIMPSVLERLIKRVPSKDDIIDMLHESDFDVETPLSYLGNDWLKDYSNIEGPLLESWRMRDSFFSQASEEEIRIGIEIVKTMKSNGTLKSFFEEHDRTSSLGTFTFFVALKK